MFPRFRNWLKDSAKLLRAERFERVEALYDDSYALRTDSFAKSHAWETELGDLIGRLTIGSQDRVLDLGCNTGRLLDLVHRSVGAECIGVDRNGDAIARGRTIFADRQLDLYDGVHLPYSDEFFDVVILSHVLGHVADPAVCLREVRRVLRSNGKVGIITPNRIFKTYMVPRNLIKGYQADPTVLRFYSASSLKRELSDAIFRIIDLDFIGETPAWLGCFAGESCRSRLLAIGQRT